MPFHQYAMPCINCVCLYIIFFALLLFLSFFCSFLFLCFYVVFRCSKSVTELNGSRNRKSKVLKKSHNKHLVECCSRRSTVNYLDRRWPFPDWINSVWATMMRTSMLDLSWSNSHALCCDTHAKSTPHTLYLGFGIVVGIAAATDAVDGICISLALFGIASAAMGSMILSPWTILLAMYRTDDKQCVDADRVLSAEGKKCEKKYWSKADTHFCKWKIEMELSAKPIFVNNNSHRP